MKGRRGFTLIELLVVIAIVAILAAILFPVFAKARQAAQKSRCQSNMKQLGAAFKMYLQDWHDTYPTNKTVASGVPGVITQCVSLTAPSTLATGVKPSNLSWVEGLYQYMEPPTDTGGGKIDSGAWACGAASQRTQPLAGGPVATCMVSYAMNANLVEQPEGIIKSSDHLMLARELDWLANSLLRPENVSTDGTAAQQPQSCFMNTSDKHYSIPMTGQIHSNGSHILFADSHVKFFTVTLMPLQANLQYDTTDSQWYNFVTTGPPDGRKSIAITP